MLNRTRTFLLVLLSMSDEHNLFFILMAHGLTSNHQQPQRIRKSTNRVSFFRKEEPSKGQNRWSARNIILSASSAEGTTLADSDVPSNKETAPSAFRELHQPWKVLHNGTLQVDDVHTLSFQIYGPPSSSLSGVEETTTGNSKKLVGLFLHGGPGAACFPNHARFFDPERYHRVVLVDQRGCGQSTPLGCLTNNTLQDLANDCELLKNHLKIPHWDVVLGGSWGTTLALAYAQTFPSSVRSMILRGVFLLRPQEVDWLFSSQGGAAQNYKQAFEAFSKVVGVSVNDENPLLALQTHYQRLWASTNETERSNAARSWMQWEFFNSVAYKIPPSTNLSDSNATMNAIRSWQHPPVPPVAVWENKEAIWRYQDPSGTQLLEIPPGLPDLNDSSIQAALRQNISIGFDRDDPPRDSVPVTPTTPYYLGSSSTTNRLPIQAMLTCYYSTNCDWCRNYLNLLDPERMQALESIPCTIVQGGSDGICPPDSALDLVHAWPINGSVELRIPMHAGHSMYDPLVTNELVMATNHMVDAVLLS